MTYKEILKKHNKIKKLSEKIYYNQLSKISFRGNEISLSYHRITFSGFKNRSITNEEMNFIKLQLQVLYDNSIDKRDLIKLFNKFNRKYINKTLIGEAVSISLVTSFLFYVISYEDGCIITDTIKCQSYLFKVLSLGIKYFREEFPMLLKILFINIVLLLIIIGMFLSLSLFRFKNDLTFLNEYEINLIRKKLKEEYNIYFD